MPPIGALNPCREFVLSQPTSLIEEMQAAARGVLALVAGDRRAVHFFDFSTRGLAGSFIAFLIATAINAYLPLLLGMQRPGSSIGRDLLTVAILFSLQVGCSALLLRQLKRMDGFVPYLVADNWSTFFVTLLSMVLTLLHLGGDVLTFGVFILVMLLEINIARLVLTLRPLHIVMLLVAQMVGVLVGLLFFGALLAPEVTASLAQ